MRSDANDRPDLANERLRADLREWAEANAHDPGVALLQLFAYLADAFSAVQDSPASEQTSGAARRYLSVRLQQGRVAIDTDWNEGSPRSLRWGLYRGIVVGATDPLMKGRLQVQVPSVFGANTLPWAMPCFDPAGTESLPAVGSLVWVAFEEGDQDYPVWLGVFP